MGQETFLTLVYIYLLIVSDKYEKLFLKDMKKKIITIYKDSNNVSDFLLKFMSECLSSPEKDYQFCRKFCLFIKENNKLLGYK